MNDSHFNRDHFETVLADFVEDDPLACQGILSVARLVFTTEVPTLAVTLRDDPPLLLVNPEFIAEHAKTEDDIRAVLARFPDAADVRIPRIDYGFTPLMFASALLQYSSADRAFNTNLRFRWEYAPGSEIFLVYSDERDMTPDAFITPTTLRGIKNRTFIIKVNRLFRY